MRGKSPVSKHGAKGSYHDDLVPGLVQSGQAIKILKNLNMTKLEKKTKCLLRHKENVVYNLCEFLKDE